MERDAEGSIAIVMSYTSESIFSDRLQYQGLQIRNLRACTPHTPAPRTDAPCLNQPVHSTPRFSSPTSSTLQQPSPQFPSQHIVSQLYTLQPLPASPLHQSTTTLSPLLIMPQPMCLHSDSQCHQVETGPYLSRRKRTQCSCPTLDNAPRPQRRLLFCRLARQR